MCVSFFKTDQACGIIAIATWQKTERDPNDEDDGEKSEDRTAETYNSDV